MAKKTKKRNASKKSSAKSIPQIIIAIALCVFMILSNLGLAGTVGNLISEKLFGVFGLIQNALPILILAFTIYFAIFNGQKKMEKKGIVAIVLVLLISIFFHIYTYISQNPAPIEAFKLCAKNKNGGGIVAGSIGYLLLKFFGKVGSLFICYAAIICCIGFLFDSLIVKLFKFIVKKIKKQARKSSKEKNNDSSEEPEKKLSKDSTKESKKDATKESKKDAIKESKKESKGAKKSTDKTETLEKDDDKFFKEIDSALSKKISNYEMPPLDLLNDFETVETDSEEYIDEMSDKLVHALKNFNIIAEVTEVTKGPAITRFEFTIPDGVKVSKIVNLKDDIKLALAVTDIHLEAPIPGKSAIGIEVPNKDKSIVSFKALVTQKEFSNAKSKLSICVGKNIAGETIVGNIEKFPHLLIAGATGSGKSVFINTLIMSILYHAKPTEVKMIMVDPKIVELSVYNGIPHLLTPVVTDVLNASKVLKWAVQEMMKRYDTFAQNSVRNIEGYNKKSEVKMPQIVIIIDELADLMMTDGKAVEESITRLAQLARAAGIHLVMATQRPTTDVITGLIKANVPSRIAFSVSSAIDSRVILDEGGAEDLLGNGDMIYIPQGAKPERLQGAYVSDEEISNVVEFLSKAK